MAEKKKKERTKVRVERVDTKCGAVEHMTVDEIRARAMGPDVELACPQCGEIHLTEEDAREAAARKISDRDKYRAIKKEAVEEGD
ncbi:hypothetical protein AAU61_02350 [Desulfocarbo indianensis]|nr:hypothetical protein AAU61_02350 [Desulfocarbo indianensis]